jgi:hypothetical protein
MARATAKKAMSAKTTRNGAKLAARARAAGAKAARTGAGKFADFQATYDALVALLKPYEPGLVLGVMGSSGYVLNSTKLGANKHPYMFAAVRIGKGYVSYYFMPVYMNPRLEATISEELKARMQGKACFNFTQPDPELFEELAELTRAGYADFQKAGYL